MKLKSIFLTVVLAIAFAGIAAAQQAMPMPPRPSLSMDNGAGQTVTIEAVSHEIIRVTVAPKGWNDSRPTELATLAQGGITPIHEVAFSKVQDGVGRLSTLRDVNVICDGKKLTIRRGNDILVTDNLNRAERSITLACDNGGGYYGAGERGYSFNLIGDTLVNFNKQNYGYVAGEKRISQMGITMPFVITAKGYGIFFDDYCRSTLVCGAGGVTYTTTADAPVSYFVITGEGNRIDNVVSNFTALVGRQELPPLWTLGYITSKYGYRDQAETEGVIDTLQRAGYPVDGIVLDLYWYGKEQDMGRLAWDPAQWPDHRGMLSRLKRKGVNVVTISQPYILTNGRGVDNYNELNAKGLLCLNDSTGKSQDVTIWVGEGGMFDVSNPATRRWLADRYRTLTDDGVGGWWGDLGEPEVHPLSIRHHNGLSAEQFHNLYGNEWSRIIYDLFKQQYPDRRLMTMMRAGTAGLQRYSVFPWSTDVSRSWGGFQPQVTIMLNSGLSGLGYMSHDVGGFAIDPEHPRDGELYIRWLQLGLFSPVLRTHSQQIAEPYKYEEFGDLTLRIINDRYRWLPYNYTLAYENASAGLPLVRPLGLYDTANSFASYDGVNDQYLWGRDILVAPVMKQGATERVVRFPEGNWRDFNNPAKRFNGLQSYNVEAPIEVLPLFVREGAFIPLAEQTMRNVGDYNPDRLTIYHFPGNEPSSFTLFDDDLHSTGTLAEGRHRLITFSAVPERKQCTITIKGEGAFAGAKPSKDYTLVIPALDKKPKSVKVNGKKLKAAKFDKATGCLTIPLAIPDIAAATTVEIK